MTPQMLQRAVIIVTGFILLDIIFKTMIVQSFQPGEMKEVVAGLFSIGRIQTLRAAFGFQNSTVFFLLTGLALQALLVLLAVRIFKRKLNRFYTIAMVLIIGGWAGDYIDWMLFSSGNLGYVSTGYFYFHFLDPVLSLSACMNSLGWMLLLFSVVVYFKDLRLLFSKKYNVAQTGSNT
jgi:lipoprotein signal peptidase